MSDWKKEALGNGKRSALETKQIESHTAKSSAALVLQNPRPERNERKACETTLVQMSADDNRIEKKEVRNKRLEPQSLLMIEVIVSTII